MADLDWLNSLASTPQLVQQKAQVKVQPQNEPKPNTSISIESLGRELKMENKPKAKPAIDPLAFLTEMQEEKQLT